MDQSAKISKQIRDFQVKESFVEKHQYEIVIAVDKSKSMDFDRLTFNPELINIESTDKHPSKNKLSITKTGHVKNNANPSILLKR